MLDEIFKGLSSYQLDSLTFFNSDILIEFLTKLDKVPLNERTPYIDAISNKALEILIFGNKEKIIDLNYLLNLVKILSKQRYFNVSITEHILNVINDNFSQIYFKPKHYIPLIIKNFGELQFKNKDIYKNQNFINIFKKILVKENFKYFDDYSYVMMLLSINYMKELQNNEIKFLLEYTISKDRKIYKFLQFGSSLLRFNKNILKQMFITVTTFDESISPITFKVEDNYIPLIILAYYKDLNENSFSVTTKFRYLISLFELYYTYLLKDLNKQSLTFSNKEITYRIMMFKSSVAFLNHKNVEPVIKLVTDVLISFFREYKRILSFSNIIEIYSISSSQNFILCYDMRLFLLEFSDREFELFQDLNTLLTKHSDSSKHILKSTRFLENCLYLLIFYTKVNYFEPKNIQSLLHNIQLMDQEVLLRKCDNLTDILYYLDLNNKYVLFVSQKTSQIIKLMDTRYAKMIQPGQSRNFKPTLSSLKYIFIKRNHLNLVNERFISFSMDWLEEQENSFISKEEDLDTLDKLKDTLRLTVMYFILKEYAYNDKIRVIRENTKTTKSLKFIRGKVKNISLPLLNKLMKLEYYEMVYADERFFRLNSNTFVKYLVLEEEEFVSNDLLRTMLEVPVKNIELRFFLKSLLI